jgi:tetratricopeptide (TPR) repeat protein
LAKPLAEIWASKGLAYWTRGQYDSATIAYQNAVRIDSMYVEAWGMLGDAAGFSAPFDLRPDHDSVLAHQELAERAKERFEALGGTVESVDPTLEEARRAVSIAPRNPEAQWQLKEAMRKEYWKRGWEPDSVRVHLLRSIELDPHDSYKRSMLLVYYICLGDAEGIRRTYDEAMAFGIRGLIVEQLWPAIAGLMLGSEEQRDSILVLVPESSISNIIGHRLLLAQDDMDLTARAALIGWGPRWAPSWLVYAALAGGQWTEALRIIEQDGNERTSMPFVRAGLAGAGVPDLSPQQVRALRDTILASDMETQLGTVKRLHVLGLLSARSGESAAAQTVADSLEEYSSRAWSMPVPKDVTAEDPLPAELAGMAADAALEVRSLDRWLQGRPQEALALLERQAFDPVSDFRDYSWVTARTFGRFLRAEILYELGQYEEAAGWYATIPRVKMWFHRDALLFAPVFRGRARALDALGRHEEALHYYRRFATRWQDADPHLQPQVEEARQRIRELEAELN